MKVIEWSVSGLTVLFVIITCITLGGCDEADGAEEVREGADSEGVVVGETLRNQADDESSAVVDHVDREPEAQGSKGPEETQAAPERPRLASAESPRLPAREASVEPQQSSVNTRPTRSTTGNTEPSAETREASNDMEPELVERDGLMVNRVVMARDIEDRSPVEEGTSFRSGEDERIYAYLELANPEREQQELTVAWLRTDRQRPDDVVSQVEVNVGPHPRWRTWAYSSRLRRPGQYMVVVRDAEDEVIARAPFEVIQ